MKYSMNRILTTHAGSLSRPANLIALSKSIAIGEAKEDDPAYAQVLAASVADVVKKQRSLGVDIPDDGEFGKPVAGGYDYGARWNYAFARMSGFSPAGSAASAAHETQHKKSSVADVALDIVRQPPRLAEIRRVLSRSGIERQPDGQRGAPAGGAACLHRAAQIYRPCGARGRHRQSEKGAGRGGAEEGFMCSIGPGSFARGVDLYYKTEEEFLFAAADAMRDEYKAIVDAGIVLQIDDPSLPDNRDMINPEPPLRNSRNSSRCAWRRSMMRCAGLPADRIRFHICWGSWHGPHTTDIPLADIVDLVFSVNAGAYSVEAGNVRHEHEWRVWKRVNRRF